MEQLDSALSATAYKMGSMPASHRSTQTFAVICLGGTISMLDTPVGLMPELSGRVLLDELGLGHHNVSTVHDLSFSPIPSLTFDDLMRAAHLIDDCAKRGTGVIILQDCIRLGASVRISLSKSFIRHA